MKKPSSKIREDIARLQEQLKHAETREAERIGRIALKAGLGDIAIDEVALQCALEEVASSFRQGRATGATRRPGTNETGAGGTGAGTTAVPSGAAQGGSGEV
ncbi:MAG: conjugal transfer protein TraC [Pseudorhizobium sp.]